MLCRAFRTASLVYYLRFESLKHQAQVHTVFGSVPSWLISFMFQHLNDLGSGTNHPYRKHITEPLN